jgi:hypothetical protein
LHRDEESACELERFLADDRDSPLSTKAEELLQRAQEESRSDDRLLSVR